MYHIHFGYRAIFGMLNQLTLATEVTYLVVSQGVASYQPEVLASDHAEQPVWLVPAKIVGCPTIFAGG